MKHTLLIMIAMIAVFAQGETSFAQTAKRATPLRRVVVRNVGLARVSVSKGAVRRTIDLSEDVAGCVYVSSQMKGVLNKRGCAAPPATFKLIDATTQNGNSYLILLSNAMDNCNVCGQCGASEASALIWLELDPRLRVLKKKSIAIEDCRASISLRTTTEMSDSDDAQDLVRFKGDNLIFEIEKEEFEESGDMRTFRISLIEYNRKEPAKGFVITTRMRPRSSPTDQ